MGDVGTGWVAQPEHWSALVPGAVLELGGVLALVVDVGAWEGRRWLKTSCTGNTTDGHWAPVDDPDPLAMVLVRRDVLAGQVIEVHNG